MDKETVFREMRQHGFRRNSRNWRDYSNAKRDLLWDKTLTPDQYGATVRLIAEYLGL